MHDRIGFCPKCGSMFLDKLETNRFRFECGAEVADDGMFQSYKCRVGQLKRAIINHRNATRVPTYIDNKLYEALETL